MPADLGDRRPGGARRASGRRRARRASAARASRGRTGSRRRRARRRRTRRARRGRRARSGRGSRGSRAPAGGGAPGSTRAERRARVDADGDAVGGAEELEPDVVAERVAARAGEDRRARRSRAGARPTAASTSPWSREPGRLAHGAVGVDLDDLLARDEADGVEVVDVQVAEDAARGGDVLLGRRRGIVASRRGATSRLPSAPARTALARRAVAGVEPPLEADLDEDPGARRRARSRRRASPRSSATGFSQNAGSPASAASRSSGACPAVGSRSRARRRRSASASAERRASAPSSAARGRSRARRRRRRPRRRARRAPRASEVERPDPPDPDQPDPHRRAEPTPPQTAVSDTSRVTRTVPKDARADGRRLAPTRSRVRARPARRPSAPCCP